MRFVLLFLFFTVFAVVSFSCGVAIGRRAHGYTEDEIAARKERDVAYVVMRSTVNSLRLALNDPTLSPGTTIALDDARMTLERNLPEDLRP